MKYFYEKLLSREEVEFLHNKIWVPRVPRKDCLDSENPRKQKVVCLSWCYMCEEAGQDVDHILLHCG